MGDAVYHRRYLGSWKKRAIAAEAVAREIRSMKTDDIAYAYDRGWQAGWAEAIKHPSDYHPPLFATNPNE